LALKEIAEGLEECRAVVGFAEPVFSFAASFLLREGSLHGDGVVLGESSARNMKFIERVKEGGGIEFSNADVPELHGRFVVVILEAKVSADISATFFAGENINEAVI